MSEQETLSIAYYKFNLGNIPKMTENCLLGRKASSQTNKMNDGMIHC